MNTLHKLLLVEDDADWLDLYCEYLKSDEFELTTARTISQAFSLLEQNEFDVVVTDLKMIGFGNEFGGFNVLNKVKENNPSTQVIVITAYGTEEIALRSMQQGAFSIVYKPPEPDRLRMTVRGAAQAKSVLSQRQKTNKAVRVESADAPAPLSMNLFGILGNSRMMRQAFEKISYAANIDQSVFIFGEKGTGKSFLAKTIHANSSRKNRPFSRLEFSDLSIHWDSINNNIKRFSGGTFFVDNLLSIGENEGKLLTDLYELTMKGNVRLISALATNVSDITQIHRSSGLPLSILDKIMPIPIFMPSLRFRRDGDDIPALIGNYIHNKPRDFPGDKQIVISSKAMEKLVSLEYGTENIIELYRTLERALSLVGSEGEVLEEHILIKKESDHQIAETNDNDARHVFISYAKDDSVMIDQLQKDLEKYGIKTWRDRDQLLPGARWKSEIRKAVKDGAFFIFCFSKASANRSSTYMYEELNLAIEELRLKPRDRAWFIPVKLNECEIPDWNIGGGETLSDIQYLEFFTNWEKSMVSLVSVIKNASNKARS